MRQYSNLFVMGFVAIIFMIIVLRILLKIRKIVRTGLITDGIIVNTISQNSADAESYSRYPVVKFVTEKNVVIVKMNDIGVIPGIYKVGQIVEVVYNRDQPELFFIKDRITLIVPAIFLLIALIFVSIIIFHLVYV